MVYKNVYQVVLLYSMLLIHNSNVVMTVERHIDINIIVQMTHA